MAGEIYYANFTELNNQGSPLLSSATLQQIFMDKNSSTDNDNDNDDNNDNQGATGDGFLAVFCGVNAAAGCLSPFVRSLARSIIERWWVDVMQTDSL